MRGCVFPWRERTVQLAVVAFGLVLGAVGCRKADYSTQTETAGDNLGKVGAAYMKAVEVNKRPPRSVDDIKTFLKEHGDPDTLLKSPNDGEPYVIVWGVNPYDEAYVINPVIIMYEKKGKDGRRFAYGTNGPSSLSEVEWSNVKFPAGHKPTN